MDGHASSLPLQYKIPTECSKFEEESSEYMDAVPTGEDVERMSIDSSGDEFEEKMMTPPPSF